MNQETILLVDDGEGEGDRFLMRAACASAKFRNPLHEVSDGEQAIAYLQGNGTIADRRNTPCPRSCCST